MPLNLKNTNTVEDDSQGIDYCDLEDYNYAIKKKTLQTVLWFVLGYGFLILAAIVTVLTIVEEFL